jgi:hypothetical protein
MATLNSPGVSVSVIDESFYTPSAPGTVPMIFVASAQDKTNPSGTTALGTTAANAGKIWLMTSQRDLTDTFGVPSFYTDASGNSLHGDELNEYGLQAAYSLLGVSSRAYVVRADVNTSKLLPQSSAPNGAPADGQLWVDTATSVFGIKEWNSTKATFTVKTPLVLDDDAPSSSFNGTAPSDTIGQPGDYCLVLTKDNGATTPNQLYYKTSSFTWTAVLNTFDSGKETQIGPHYTYPAYTTSTVNASVWITTTTLSNGADWKVKKYNASTQAWGTVSAPLYGILPEATNALDATGGKNIAVGSVFVETDATNSGNNSATFKVWSRRASGALSITGAAASELAVAGSYTFVIRETKAGSNAWSASGTITINPGDNTKTIASYIPAAIAGAGLTNVSASYDSTTAKLTITHRLGGDIEINDITGSPFTNSGFSTSITGVYAAPSGDTGYNFILSNWKPASFKAVATAPYSTPADGQLWYSSIHDEVDIMVHDGTKWTGYLNAYPTTSPAGPIISATEPDKNTGQSDGSALVDNDIWIDTSDMEMYGKNIYIYKTSSGWVKQDVTDQSTPDGWLFADARWATAGNTLTASSITALLSSDYLDPDAPDPAIYPRGMHLVNTRRSGFNVKEYMQGYIDIYANDGLNARYPHGGGESMAAYQTDRWVSQHNVAADGSGVFGRHAQRAQIVAALKSTIDTNTNIRDTDTVVFNLIATPGYPEAIQNMVAYNTDRGITAFVVGDTPFRLEPTGTALHAWGLNTALATDNGDEGGTSYDEYMAMYYPSGYTNDNAGNYIVVPPSHMMLRTIINSDAKSFQWFAPAGTRRGGIDNATAAGYITSEGEFKTNAINLGLRDVLSEVKINPIATLTGVGLVAYGQKTRAKNASSLDRINVARLVCYLRRQLDILARPFLFEPNDAQTRREIKAAAESLMLELVGSRALYDYVVVCDETNNTPARIDRNELYMDIAIEPVKAVEFIYIPLRLKNTGDIKAGL